MTFLKPSEETYTFGMAVAAVEVAGLGFPVLGYGELTYWCQNEDLALIDDTYWTTVRGFARTTFVLVPANDYGDLYRLCESLPAVAMTVDGFSADKGKPCLLTLFPHRCRAEGRRLILEANATHGDRRLFTLRVEA